MCNPRSQVSAHFLITPSGEIIELVPVTKRAWHAGRSYWQNKRDLNHCSIGIELQYTPLRCHQTDIIQYPIYEKKQLENLVKLLDFLCHHYSISPLNILGHQDIAPSRKLDPGPQFPWKMLAQMGFGLWPSPMAATILPALPFFEKSFFGKEKTMSVSTIQQSLSAIGYDCPHSNLWDLQTLYCWKAHQAHWIS